MAIIPGGQQIRTIDASVDMTERGSALINRKSEVYTMNDILETVGDISAGNEGLDWDETTKTLSLATTGTGSDSAFISVEGQSIEFRDSDSTVRFPSSDILANSFNIGGAGNSVLLDNGLTLALSSSSGNIARIGDLEDSLSLSSTIVTSTNAVIGHIGGMNEVNSVSNVTITIQENAVEDIPVGSVLTYQQKNTGRVVVGYSGTATGDSGQTYKNGDVLTLWHKSLNNWTILNKPHALDSTTEGEPTGSDQIFNVVSLTQAEYDAGTPVAGTFYVITT